ncbi:MAG: PAS domain-containing sensor histidine kinase [Planctomycetota bacterium]|nr:MAG: PAS domain-containing sensor histidine kinase [Planctomycetota bacterium]
MRFAWKIFLGAILVVVTTTLLVEGLAARNLKERRIAQIDQQLLDDSFGMALAVAPVIEAGDRPRLQMLADAAAGRHLARRITLLAADGSVLADSHEQVARMANHAHRAEVEQPGTIHERRSSTLDTLMRYAAERVIGSDGQHIGYARIALPVRGIDDDLASLGKAIRTGALVALLAGLVLSLILARRVSGPLGRISELLSALGRGESTARLPVESNDEIGNLAAAVNDMAAQLQRRQAVLLEEVTQKEAVLSAMEEGVLAVDDEQRVVLANRAARRWLIDPRGDPVNKRLAEITRVPEILAGVRAAVRNERVEDEFSLDVPGLGERVVGLSANPAASGKGPRVAVLVLRDLTEIRRLEKVRTDFVANVSHELKTPLTSMRGYVEAVIEDADMPHAQRVRFLKKASQNTERLTDIVSDLLDLARIESGTRPVDHESVELGALASECARRAASDAEHHGVEVRLHPAEGPLRVSGDRKALATAIDNLLSNAVKYSPPGHPVDLTLTSDGAQHCLAVRDEGPGIARHEQERIFERFYRVDKDRSRALGGTGLGLSIVRNVARAHGGEVSIESATGAGSCFRLRLPSA